MNRSLLILRALAIAVLPLGLAACRVTVESDARPTVVARTAQASLITDFQPVAGEGSIYRVGQNVRFALTTRTPGYVTLVSLDPNGNSNVLIRGAPVPAGTTVFPRAEDRVEYTLTPPLGMQRVRAIFTTQRPTNQLVLRGTYGVTEFQTATNTYARPYGTASDVAETFFYIR